MLKETKFRHVVCFVENCYFNSVKVNVARFHEVNKATWASNNNVNAITHGCDLSAVANAAVHGCGAHAD